MPLGHRTTSFSVLQGIVTFVLDVDKTALANDGIGSYFSSILHLHSMFEAHCSS
jgi:hypothetical protein